MQVYPCRPSHNPPSLCILLLFATIVRQNLRISMGIEPPAPVLLFVICQACSLLSGGPTLTSWLLQAKKQQNCIGLVVVPLSTTKHSGYQQSTLRKITSYFPVSKLALWKLVGAVWKIR